MCNCQCVKDCIYPFVEMKLLYFTRVSCLVNVQMDKYMTL